jgi:translation initiation factor IF-3
LKNRKRSNNRVFINRDIRAKEVRCIDHNEQNLGIIKTYEAIKLAQDAGLDLVMISSPNKGQAPVCKILDSGKYKYDLSKRKKDIARKQRESAVKLKEIKFRPTTDINDLKTKAKHAEKFLVDGCKIKVSIRFKGREMAHKNIAYDRIFEFVNLIGIAQVDENPRMDGRNMTCMLSLNKAALAKEKEVEAEAEAGKELSQAV